ncbi:MAG TPA: thioredoxin domain-containing protein [Gemmatimonadaceae bacterium]|jgi:protein-disulfide isomerase|nr:thioredoxin domain-containing protein [Gemmatimonadaceae bacterium]
MSSRALALVLFTIACKGAEDARARTASGTPEAAAPAAPTATADAAGANDPLVARADSARIRGNPNAKVWMIIASDFQCPYCKMWHDSADMIIRREYVDNGKVRLAFVNFPIGSHQNAVPASEYAMCAGAQSKFWEMHDAIFGAQEVWSRLQDASPVFDELAGKVGLDRTALQACLRSDKMLPIIQADYEKASRSGVRATPSFFIGNQLFEGVQSAEDLRRVLDTALAGGR